MNIFNLALLVHMSGATILAIFVLQTVKALYQNESESFSSLAEKLAGGTAVQLISGSILALTHPQSESVLGFCSKVGLYMGIIFIAESALYIRSQKLQQTSFPLVTILRVVSIALPLTISTAFTLA